MLSTPPPHETADLFMSDAAAALNPGTAHTASATTHTKGSWKQLGADLTDEIVGFWLNIAADVSPSTTDNRALLDIGVDLAGGTSFTAVVQNLNVYGAGLWSGTGGTGPKMLYIPLRLPAGAAIAVRHQAALASDAMRTAIVGYQKAQAPWQQWAADTCDTYGADTAASEGTAISAANQGATGAEGTWVQITAATLREHRALLLTLGIDTADTNTIARGFACDIGYDIGGGSNYVPLVENLQFVVNSIESIIGPFPPAPIECTIPAGSSLAVRASCSGTTSDVLSAILHAFT